MKIVLLLVLIITALTEGFVINTTGVPTNDSGQISLSVDSDLKLNITNNDKSNLRYGFQQTRLCQVYEKAFLCIRKCLDLGYEIAHADKHCLCTCKQNKMLANYKAPHFGPTKWKAGAPTTSLPSWVKKQSNKLSVKEAINSTLNDIEVYGDVSDPTDTNGTAQDGTAGSSLVKQELKNENTLTNEEKKPTTTEEENTAANDGAPAANDGAPAANDGAPAANDGAPAVNDGAPAANEGEISNTTDGKAATNEEGATTNNQMTNTIDGATKATTGPNNETLAEGEAKVDNTGATTNNELNNSNNSTTEPTATA